MNRRNFISTMLGTLAASSVRIPVVEAAVDPLAGFAFAEYTTIRGSFINGAFVRVCDFKNYGDHIAMNPDYFDAPIELEVWTGPEKKVAVVARDRISGSLQSGEIQTCV